MITIVDYINLIKPPFSAVADANGYIHDSATLAVVCDRRHIHRYFLNDIAKNSGITSCYTCSAGNKTTSVIRQVFEDILEIPFMVLKNKIIPTSVIEYYNPIIKVIVVCSRDEKVIVTKPEWLICQVKLTVSKKAIKQIIRDELGSILTEKQRGVVIPSNGKTPVPLREKSQKSSLPYSMELIHQQSYTIGMIGDNLIKQLAANDNQSSLFLENCAQDK